MKQIHFILLSLLVTLFLPHSAALAAEGKDSSSLTLLYSNNVAGEFEPCG